MVQGAEKGRDRSVGGERPSPAEDSQELVGLQGYPEVLHALHDGKMAKAKVKMHELTNENF